MIALLLISLILFLILAVVGGFIGLSAVVFIIVFGDLIVGVYILYRLLFKKKKKKK